MIQHHLILGGTGFIGRHVAALLACTGNRVTVVTRSPQKLSFPLAAAPRIEWQVFDFASADWNSLLTGVDVVHHYAWSTIPASANADPAGDLLSNLGATLKLLDALRQRGNGRIVFASSGGTVYGKLCVIPVDENTSLAPITAYGVSKVTAELYLKLYRKMHGLDCRIARISNPYGAGQDVGRGLGAVTTLVHRALTGEKIVIWGNGEIVRDYIHISDVASCLVKLACAPPSDADFVFNVGSGVGVSLNEIVAELEMCLGRRLPITRTEARVFDVPVSVLSIDRARQALEWSPRVSFHEGIALTLADLQANRFFSTSREPHDALAAMKVS